MDDYERGLGRMAKNPWVLRLEDEDDFIRRDRMIIAADVVIDEYGLVIKDRDGLANERLPTTIEKNRAMSVDQAWEEWKDE